MPYPTVCRASPHFFLGLPASLRFSRQRPFWFLLLGCLPTCGISLPARLSVAIAITPFLVCLLRVVRILPRHIGDSGDLARIRVESHGNILRGKDVYYHKYYMIIIC